MALNETGSHADRNDFGINAPTDLRQKLHAAYRVAFLRREAESLTLPHHWKSYDALRKVHGRRRAEAQDTYHQTYRARVEVRLRELIDKAGSKTVDHNLPGAMGDRFSKSDLLRQAHRDVRHAHRNHMARLRRTEEHDLEVLLTKAGRETAIRGKAKSAFERAQDRRSGEGRRQKPRDSGSTQVRRRPHP